VLYEIGNQCYFCLIEKQKKSENISGKKAHSNFTFYATSVSVSLAKEVSFDT